MKKVLFFIALLLCIQSAFADDSWSGGADINGDGIVDYKDFAIMANHWLDEEPNCPGITWVYIDDPGVEDHEGFTGYMSKYETTNDQYCTFLNSAKADGLVTVYDNIVYAADDPNHTQPYFDTYAASSYSQITYSDGEFSVRTRDGYYMGNHPVVMVSWYGATAFADYYVWRLPTEWEWRAVADYDGSYIYGCGTTIDQSKANYYDGGYANPLNLSSHPYTSPVVFYSAYGYGLCNMAGNVREWTSSYYGGVGARVLGNGDYDTYACYCELTYRDGYAMSGRVSNLGFRLVMDSN